MSSGTSKGSAPSERVADDFYAQVLAVMQDEHCEDLWWKVDDGRVRVFVNCNDFFWWGCADCVEVTRDNLHILRQAIADGDLDGGPLFCARVRGMRPQGAVYHLIDEEHRPLFDACGPERPIDIGNPKSQEGEYLYTRPKAASGGGSVG